MDTLILRKTGIATIPISKIPQGIMDKLEDITAHYVWEGSENDKLFCLDSLLSISEGDDFGGKDCNDFIEALTDDMGREGCTYFRISEYH